MNKRVSILFLVDYYKHSHSKMYYPGTKRITSYFESRGTDFEYADSTIFFGLQYFLTEYLQGVTFTQQDIHEAKEMCKDAFDNENVFDTEMWQYILDKYNGKLPLKIRAVREGSKVPLHNVLYDITCNDDKCVSLTNFVETLLQNVWYPTSVATLSFYIKQLVIDAFHKTVDDDMISAVDFVLNDFGSRGVSSPEESMIGGMSHLINFMGSDNMSAHWKSKYTYFAKPNNILKTVPATEHSVMTLLGKSGEVKVFKHCMDLYPTGILSMVVDGFNVFNAVENIFGKDLKNAVINRNGTIVLRLDSGSLIPTILTTLNILFEKFGYTVNKKGYKVLPPYIRIMQADGVNYDSIKEIYDVLEKNGISAINIVFGMGGALLRKVNRDTFKIALKCCSALITNENGIDEEIDVQKNPIEMDDNYELKVSYKKSKAGILKLIIKDGQYLTVRQDDQKYKDYDDQLVVVFENGDLFNVQKWEDIKHKINSHNVL